MPFLGLPWMAVRELGVQGAEGGEILPEFLIVGSLAVGCGQGKMERPEEAGD